ncbi:MAG: M28 family peptidase [Leptolinea sp.]
MIKFIKLTLVGVWLLTACQGQPKQLAPQNTLRPTFQPTVALLIKPSPQPPLPTATIKPSPTLRPVEENGKIALKHLQSLAGKIGARSPGTPQETDAAEYIQKTFEELGFSTEVQPFTFKDDDEGQMSSQNVVAGKPGLSNKTLIVGAHYDSGDEAKGADDNASGAAVMLEAAELISKIETPYTIIFIAFGAEENDLDGSSYYVEQMSSSAVKNSIVMINLDSLVAGNLAYVYGDAGPDTLRDWILDMATKSGIKLEGKTAADLNNDDGSLCECSDYDAFQQENIPFVYFEATDWSLGENDGMTQVDPNFGDEGEIRHTKFDTIETINQLFPDRIEQKLNLFVTLLVNTLTDFKLP